MIPALYNGVYKKIKKMTDEYDFDAAINFLKDF